MPWAKEEILFEWSRPKEVLEAVAKARIKRIFIFYPKVLIVAAIIWALIYFICDYLFPRNYDVNLGKIFVLSFGLCLVIIPLEYLRAVAIKFSRGKYRITANKVYIGSDRIIRWKDVVGYKLTDSEYLKGFGCLKLYYRKGRFSSLICLPQDEQKDEIIKYTAQRAPLLEDLQPDYEAVKLTAGQTIFLCIFTFAYSAVLSWYIVLYKASWYVGFLPVIIILGPGSIYFLIAFGKRLFKNPSLTRVALMSNCIAGLLIMLMTIFLQIYHWKQTIPGW